MLKEAIIVTLILLVIGLYFAPAITKGIIRVTGKATADITKNLWNEIKESEEMKNLTKEAKDIIKDKAKEKIKGG